MYFGWLGLAIALSYLLGSINPAIIVTRLRIGKDIRELGNKNAGAANARRTLGRGWGALVLFLDLAKGLAPMLAARVLLFRTGTDADLLAVFATGIAAIVGHCRPLYYGFRGGGGMATTLAVYLTFIPVEFLASALLAGLIVAAFVRNVQFRLARWIPMIFATIAPFLTLAVNPLFRIPLCGHLSIGGHPWSIIVGVFATSLVVLALNVRTVTGTLGRLGR